MFPSSLIYNIAQLYQLWVENKSWGAFCTPKEAHLDPIVWSLEVNTGLSFQIPNQIPNSIPYPRNTAEEFLGV